MLVRYGDKKNHKRTRPLARAKKVRMGLSVKCMIFCGEEVLLLQKKDKEGLRPWEFPGGGLEFGEDMANAAVREVREETGLHINILDMAGLWSYARTGLNFLTGVIFIAETDSKDVVLSHEHTDFAWVKPAQFKDYTLQDSLRTALEAIKIPNERGAELRRYFVDTFK